MVHKRTDGKWQISAAMNDELGKAVKEAIDNDLEMNDGRLVREALRHELQKYEQENYKDD
jgi:metal-responsive CopG/Arc/MetJ family transcriptional regulator